MSRASQGARPVAFNALYCGALLLSLCLLAACTGTARRSTPADLRAQLEREAQLATVEDWSLVGRIAVFDGSDNGSGRIEWRQHGDTFEIVFAAPVSRQSWRLSGGPDGALLEGLDGGPRRAPSAEALLEREAGWAVPLQKLRAWARGVRGTPAATVTFDAAGLPATLQEDGWTVEYRDWHEDQQPPLPRRVFAQSGERRVRLAVERWSPAAAPTGG